MTRKNAAGGVEAGGTAPVNLATERRKREKAAAEAEPKELAADTESEPVVADAPAPAPRKRKKKEKPAPEEPTTVSDVGTDAPSNADAQVAEEPYDLDLPDLGEPEEKGGEVVNFPVADRTDAEDRNAAVEKADAAFRYVEKKIEDFLDNPAKMLRALADSDHGDPDRLLQAIKDMWAALDSDEFVIDSQAGLTVLRGSAERALKDCAIAIHAAEADIKKAIGPVWLSRFRTPSSRADEAAAQVMKDACMEVQGELQSLKDKLEAKLTKYEY